MRKVLLFTLVLIFIFSTAAMAHPPQKVTTNFNMETQMLTVEFTHTVGGENSNHFVDKISIMLNGNEVITQIPGKQLENNESFNYYMPSVESGDEIEIMTYCSISGNRGTTLTVGE